ncbi:MAG: hypothetical protein KDK30_02160 [Leptospiraceae bacterium]|nr:hypothetical protein [Leptospiraceae bacterium]MCB1314459.1 hypothetical protein [Leptospiraceae bacterium]MCB1319083.1 hypothetical protein [Leptospiraceae bacterium]
MEAEVEHNEENNRLRESIKQLKKDAADIQHRARQNLHDLRDRAQGYQESAREIIDEIADYCNENPQKAALIAAATGVGFGLVLGMMLRGRR